MKVFVRAGLFCALAVAIIWFAIGYGVDTAVQRVVAREAVDKAEHWGVYMSERVPDLPNLVTTGVPTEAQERVIRDIRNVGDIFRFKLFTADGRLTLVSDDGHAQGIADVADPEPRQVGATGIPIVGVFDGSAKPDRPDIYAEAYIPLIGPEGEVQGVVEVYVDQTVTRNYFVESFRDFAIMLVAVSSLVLAVPVIAFCLQRILAQRSRRDAEFFAHFDPLTGLMNRREFVGQAERMVAEGALSVVGYLDLDHFKTINDTYGHSTGDAFLAHVAKMLRKNCRNEDLLARFGGDEFVIAFRDMPMDKAVLRARSILKDCAQEIDIQDTKLSGSISIGLAILEAGTSLERGLSNADAALYHAKSEGRGDFAVYGAEMGEELRRRHALRKRLREAAQNYDFEIHYQPLVDGADRRLIGHEALLRLNDADGSPIPPQTFIPMAEELGLIEDIGKWTIQKATGDMARVGEDLMLAINLSPAQFRSGELVRFVRDALQASGFPANRLELEITESLLLEDSPMIEMQIDTLKEMGVAIAMDDFGTGFSSLSYLWKYGFDRLKIDRSFVSALDENPQRSREIIETVVLLGSRLGMNITAEGVETSEQSKLLSDLGCDVLQGYLFGKPSPLGKIQTEMDAAPQEHSRSSGNG